VLAGVQVHQPVAGRGLQGDVAGVGEGAVPGEVDHPGAERPRDLGGAVAGAGVDDDHLVDGVADGLQATREHLLLVLDDHAQRQRHRRARPGAAGDGLGPLAERAQHRAGSAAGAGLRAALADERVVEVLGDVRKFGVEPDRRAEQRLGAAQLGQLVEQHAGQVEQHRLGRRAGERVEQALGRGHERRNPGVGLLRAVGQHQLGQPAPRLVGALRVVPALELVEQPLELAHVAAGERGGGTGRRALDAHAPAGLGGCDVGRRRRGGGRLHRLRSRPC